MKIYKITSGILVEHQALFYHFENEAWDAFINDDDVYNRTIQKIGSKKPIAHARSLVDSELQAPIQSQELWAAGVTYSRSKVGRQEESKEAGGGDFYARVYDAERPELFFKANANRIVGPGKNVRIRKDSAWNVPEPELTLVITSRGTIVAYTIGNDMSSRSIEGENPLYLPQAKTYDGCAALGPCIYIASEPLPAETQIQMMVSRKEKVVFEGAVAIGQMKRTYTELVSFLYGECSFPHGSLLMTGTGIVPSSEFTLQSGDRIEITIPPIGTLVNTVE